MASKFEKSVSEQYQKEGWNVLSNGWPDFLLWKREEGKVCLKFVEVKSENDSIRENQREVLNLLCEAGMVVRTAHAGYGYGDNHGKAPNHFHELMVDAEFPWRKE
jgi:VRR-NUC domain